MIETLDYSKIAYPIEGIPMTEKVIMKFSDLMTQADILDREDDLPLGVSADVVLRYLIYMFASGSPVKTAFPDILMRKQYVLKKLKIEASDGDGYSEMCLMSEDWIVNRFITFTRIQCSEDYGILSTAEILMARTQDMIIKTKDLGKAGDLDKYRKDLEGWRAMLVEARARILQEETSIVLQKGVTFSVKAETLGIMPEEYSRVYREKREVFPEIIP